MRFMKIKMWLSTIQRKTWIFAGVIAGFVVLAVACLLIWMHLCGYTLAEWFAKYWPTLAVLGALVLMGAFALVFYKLRKGRF